MQTQEGDTEKSKREKVNSHEVSVLANMVTATKVNMNMKTTHVHV